MAYTRERLGELLVAGGLIDEAQLAGALALQVRTGGKLGEVLVDSLTVGEEEIARVLAEQKGYEFVNLIAYPIDRNAASLIPSRLAHKQSVIPIGFEDGRLLLAMSDPLDVEAVDDVEVRTGQRVTPLVATPSQISSAIEKYIAAADAFQDLLDASEELAEEVEDSTEMRVIMGGEDVPVVRLVNQLLREAVRDRASDVHIEPSEHHVVVRYRIDGVLQEVMRLPVAARAGITSRVKIMAEMDIAERRRPQDGKIAIKIDERPVDLRVASLPTPFGESLVIRILNADFTFHSLFDLGLNERNLEFVNEMVRRPYGALLISGPTGSGKSTTLYAALQEINRPEIKIITIEDPVEYQMGNVTQMGVNTKIGLTFAAGLRTILRSDPDVVMVGEIRDPETAEIAVRAALTGHLVLSSIHTNDAPSALTRLVDMGVPPYITGSSLLGVVAQRLARKLCLKCRQPLKTMQAALKAAGYTAAEAKNVVAYGPVGCEVCGGSGYSGRIGLFEVMRIDEDVTRLFLTNAPSDQIRELVLEKGMISLRRDALDKVATGVTSLEEVARVVM